MKVVVSRHSALVDLLKDQGIIDDSVPVLSHVAPDDIQGKIVIGNLPLHLAALADQVWAPIIDVPPDLRGKDLDLSQLKKYYKGLAKYKVTKL